MKLTRQLSFALVAAVALAVGWNLLAATRYVSEQDEKAVAKVSEAWNTAGLKADTAALNKILADDYVFVDPMGTTWNKSQEISSYQTGDLKMESSTVAGRTTRLYSGGAVVTGTVTVKGKYKNDDISGDYRYVEIYEPKTPSGWQAVFAQLTKIAEKK